MKKIAMATLLTSGFALSAHAGTLYVSHIVNNAANSVLMQFKGNTVNCPTILVPRGQSVYPGCHLLTDQWKGSYPFDVTILDMNTIKSYVSKWNAFGEWGWGLNVHMAVQSVEPWQPRVDINPYVFYSPHRALAGFIVTPDYQLTAF